MTPEECIGRAEYYLKKAWNEDYQEIRLNSHANAALAHIEMAKLKMALEDEE